MQHMQRTGRIDLRENTDTSLSLDSLFSNHGGHMFGALVATDELGQHQTLKAFSGQFHGIDCVEGWVAPIHPVDALGQRVPHQKSVEAQIKALGRQIDNACSEQQKRHDQRARRDLSQQLMRDIHASYVLRNARGEQRPMIDAFVSDAGIPSGTGDCCTPKLLHACYLRGWKPVAVAEFCWGRSKVAPRESGSFYSSCSDRCEPILGFMLCGAAE